MLIMLEVNLPSNYPSASHPYIFARCSKLNECTFNKALKEYVNSMTLGEPMVWHTTEWVKSNAGSFVQNG